MTNITLEQANAIITAALAKAAELKLEPLTVAVLGSGGQLIALQNQAVLGTLRPQVAIAKASSALSLGMPSRKIGEIAAERPAFIAALGPISPHGIMPGAGGLLVVDEVGNPLGAVGVSGDTSDNDEICGIAGIVAAGLLVQP